MRFLLDENVPRELARSLAARGHDALPLPATMRAADDATILDAAARDDRAMVTLDTDFGTLVFLHGQAPPSAVVLIRLRAAELVARLEAVAAAIERGAASPVRNSGPCPEFVWARSDLASQGEDAMADARAMCAIGRRGQLGLEGRLPWEGNPGPEYRADVQRFWDMTQGHVLIAGPRTFRSIPPEAHRERTIVEIRSRMAPAEVLAQFPDRVVYVGGGPAVWTAYADLIRHWDITRLPYDGEADRWFDPAWLCGAQRDGP